MSTRQHARASLPSTTPPSAGDPPSEWPWSFRARCLASLAISVHLLAIYAAPWASPPPSSDLGRLVASWFMPYLRGTAQDNGYRFFAPDPGPSHLIRYELVTENGVTRTGQIPDREVHRPRLLYHRHFMIAEMLFTLSAQAMEPPEPGIPAAALRELEMEKEMATRLARGVARDLLRRNPDVVTVRLFSQTHLIPSPEEMRQGAGLRDPAGFPPPAPLGEFSRQSK